MNQIVVWIFQGPSWISFLVPKHPNHWRYFQNFLTKKEDNFLPQLWSRITSGEGWIIYKEDTEFFTRFWQVKLSEAELLIFVSFAQRLEVELFVHFKKLFVPSEEVEFSSIVAEFTSEKGGQICHYQRGPNSSYFSNRRDPSVNILFQGKEKFVLASSGFPHQRWAKVKFLYSRVDFYLHRKSKSRLNSILLKRQSLGGLKHSYWLEFVLIPQHISHSKNKFSRGRFPEITNHSLGISVL